MSDQTQHRQDHLTQKKWDRLAKRFDLMTGMGAEKRWAPAKQKLFGQMEGNILFLALGTGLDISFFPAEKNITAIDISPKMLEQAEQRIANYPGQLTAKVMDVHQLEFDDHQFDQVYTSCTFCSVPNPIDGLKSLHRVLKPGGALRLFEHTGSRLFPFNLQMHLMSKLSERIGPAMNRDTVSNVAHAGFTIEKVENVYLDVVKIIYAHKPG